MLLLMRPVPALPVIRSFAERLLQADLPDLPSANRALAVNFVAHRVDHLPSFTRFGVIVLAGFFRSLLALPAGFTVAKAMIKLPLPLVAEYPRLIRSLAFAYVWETWPTTTATGASATGTSLAGTTA